MRASTLFGMTIAILIGLAVVFGVKSAGLFNRTPPKIENKPAPKVLAAARNLFADMTCTSGEVTVRYVAEEEMDLYLKNKHKYMPAVPEAASFRILSRNVTAGEALLKEHFQDLGMPGSYKELLGNGMVAVNLQLPKERCVGGVLRKEDRVNVFLTTTICADGDCSAPFTATAPIAFNLRIIGKRDSIWSIMAPIDQSKPHSFTLEANPYRAALIEFAKNKGMLSLVPIGPNLHGKPGVGIFVSDSKDEETKILSVTQSLMPITDQDLEEIFKLGPINRRQPLQRTPPVVIDGWSGIKQVGRAFFPNPMGQTNEPGVYTDAGTSPSVQRPEGRSPLGYRFIAPTGGCGLPTSSKKG